MRPGTSDASKAADARSRRQPPFSHRIKGALEFAIEASNHLGADRVDTVHLLLGLVDEAGSTAARALRALGVDRSRAWARALRRGGSS